MKLVGARWGLIRRPFILRAFWIGLWAAVIANIVLGAGMYGLYSLDSYFGDLVTDDVVWVTFGVNFACGLCLTILSAFISVNRFLRMSTNKLFMN
jgi:cell division transport system permease protein